MAYRVHTLRKRSHIRFIVFRRAYKTTGKRTNKLNPSDCLNLTEAPWGKLMYIINTPISSHQRKKSRTWNAHMRWAHPGRSAAAVCYRNHYANVCAYVIRMRKRFQMHVNHGCNFIMLIADDMCSASYFCLIFSLNFSIQHRRRRCRLNHIAAFSVF